MTKFNWERAARQERVAYQGTTPARARLHAVTWRDSPQAWVIFLNAEPSLEIIAKFQFRPTNRGSWYAGFASRDLALAAVLTLRAAGCRGVAKRYQPTQRAA